MAAAPTLVDLADQNPALLLLLVAPPCYGLRRREPRSDVLRRLAGCRQVELLRWLGPPSRRSLARLFAKVELRGLRRWTLRRLVALARNEEACQRLAHLARIHDTVLWLLETSDRRKAVAPTLLQEVARERGLRRRRRFAREFADTLRLLEVLGRRPPSRGLRSIDAVACAHRRWSHEALQSGQELEGQDPPFPQAPIEGETWIEPIRSPAELLREAEEQGNCLAVFVQTARRGLQVSYRVLSPERATLAIELADAGWEITELRTAGNGQASFATWQAVRRWLQKQATALDSVSNSWEGVPWPEGIHLLAEAIET